MVSTQERVATRSLLIRVTGLITRVRIVNHSTLSNEIECSLPRTISN
jgi:hypothetical protein